MAGSTSLIDRLVTKFNLNRDEVQSVFDEERQTHMAEHTQAMKDRLTQAVTDGKLTQAQADLITAKQQEHLGPGGMKGGHHGQQGFRGEFPEEAAETAGAPPGGFHLLIQGI